MSKTPRGMVNEEEIGKMGEVRSTKKKRHPARMELVEILLLSTLKLKLVNPLHKLLGLPRNLECDGGQLVSDFPNLLWVRVRLLDAVAFASYIDQILTAVGQDLDDGAGALAQGGGGVGAGDGVFG